MNKYLALLESLLRQPKMLQADYIRENSALVAEAASRGHITSLTVGAMATRQWTITQSGLNFLVTHVGE